VTALRGVRVILALALTSTVLAGCGDAATVAEQATASTPSSTPTTAPAGWSKVAPWPYAPWYTALTAWTGKEVLVFGGWQEQHGPAPDLRNIDRAAGAYDPASNTWRKIAIPPFPQYEASVAVAGDCVYVLSFDSLASSGRLTKAHLWRYDVGPNAWTHLADPPDIVTNLTVAGGTIAAWQRFVTTEFPAVELYNRTTNTWRAGPANPWPDYYNRQLVGLPDGRVVTVEEPQQARSEEFDAPPSATWRAAVLDARGTTWHTMPPSPIAADSIRGVDWAYVGGRLVNPDPRTMSAATIAGAKVGRVGLGGILDVDGERWSPLPPLPGEPHVHHNAPKGEPQPELGWTTRDFLRAAGCDVALAYGWAYDARHNRWTEIASIPSDRDGLAEDIELWAGDRLLYWANGKVQANADRTGYRIVRAHAGWSWRP
jgi:hypothetical protein